MQLSQVFRRGVIVPRNVRSLQQLKNWAVENSVEVIYLPVLGDATFEVIWRSGVFAKLNQKCDISIDDYEEVVIATNKVAPMIEALREFRSTSPIVTDFVHDLANVCKSAEETGMPIWFIF